MFTASRREPDFQKASLGMQNVVKQKFARRRGESLISGNGCFAIDSKCAWRRGESSILEKSRLRHKMALYRNMHDVEARARILESLIFL